MRLKTTKIDFRICLGFSYSALHLASVCLIILSSVSRLCHVKSEPQNISFCGVPYKNKNKKNRIRIVYFQIYRNALESLFSTLKSSKV